MALTDKLTAIANAIRAKTGKTDKMSLDQMVTEIGDISGGGDKYLVFYKYSSGGASASFITDSNYFSTGDEVNKLVNWLTENGYTSINATYPIAGFTTDSYAADRMFALNNQSLKLVQRGSTKTNTIASAFTCRVTYKV